jgi:hypothetical protein|tara:strand:- start:123 stop:260 length:138 start_codon:yes stop_codon:yes gene_type:complete
MIIFILSVIAIIVITAVAAIILPGFDASPAPVVPGFALADLNQVG